MTAPIFHVDHADGSRRSAMRLRAIKALNDAAFLRADTDHSDHVIRALKQAKAAIDGILEELEGHQ